MIRLALLDDHPAVLAGLQRLLAPARDMEVLGAAADEVALARALRGRRPDVLIVDYDPGRGDALALCRRIKAVSVPRACSSTRRMPARRWRSRHAPRRPTGCSTRASPRRR